MTEPAAILKGLLRAALLLGVFALALVGLFVAWWIVVFALAGISIYVAVRRLIGGGRETARGPAHGAARHPGEPARSGETAVIEGEFRIEHEAELKGPPRGRSEGG